MAPSLPRHTRGNQGISRSGRLGRRLRRRRRRSTALDALPVVLLAVIAGAGPFSHIRDTAEHGQHKPTPRTSTEKEANTARPDRSGRRSARAPSEQDLRAWAAAVAAALPPLTEPQLAAVARLAAHLDANDSQKRAA
jgi:hypothetical protein